MKDVIALIIMLTSFVISLIGSSRLVVRLGYTLIGVIMGFSTFLFGSLIAAYVAAD